jgi:hypothetical protein
MLKKVIYIFRIWFGKNGGLERARPSARAHVTFALRLVTLQTFDSHHARQQSTGLTVYSLLALSIQQSNA